MKQIAFFISLFLLASVSFAGSGYQLGDKAEDFKLKNVDGSYVSMADFPDAKGFVVIFSCNHCPYVVAYEDRMIELHNEFADQGFPVIAINSNDPELQPEDSFENMQVRAKEKNFPFPYLVDDKQEVYPKFGAERTPHVYLLKRDGKDMKVAYIGTIDDNYRDASKVKERYLANAITAVMNGESPAPATTKAIGCTIKSK